MNLENQIDQMLSKITQFAENKHEVLLGKCESGEQLTSTQEHILMILANDTSTNAKIASNLNISPAAVTKAIKKLQLQELIMPSKIQSDERVIIWSLTDKALPIAQEHAKHHSKTLETYKELMKDYNGDEQKNDSTFLVSIDRGIRMKKWLLIPLLTVLFVLTACQKSTAKPEIITSFEPMYEFTKAIVGDKVEIKNIVPSNQEVHDYEPSAKDMATMSAAKVIIYNSDDLEKWVKKCSRKRS
ncbi:zinc-dependent MarR family transcriptional regulator [Lactococcus fujiensis]|uniref:zinc-dependent MarR family transcriptional regulator n=1 Tax=Lactococcus fujiensis TaxID=610251 RepID=UPI000A66FD4D|nr:zinc-dependent MarR family transcriptional regulator [Lactococcus fujiensis]